MIHATTPLHPDRLRPLDAAPPRSRLTSEDIRLLRLLARGYDARRIGRELGFAEVTVRRRIAALRSRLGARTTIHAVAIAVRAGVV